MNSLFSELYQREHDGIKCWMRPKTSDEAVFKENFEKAPVLKRASFSPGQKWLDLGAYIGTFSLFIRHRGGVTVAVEANPDNAEMYKKNMELNKIKDYHLLHGAVVHQHPPEREVKLTVMPLDAPRRAELSSGTMYPKWKRTYPTISIGTLEFDEVVKEAQRVLGADGDWNLKIDIEGAEVDILSYCDLSMFNQIFWEYHFQVPNSLEQAHVIVKRFEDMGYKVFLSRKIPKEQPTHFYEITHLGWAIKGKD